MYLLNQEKPWYLSDEWYVTVEEFDAIRRMNFPKDFIDFFEIALIDKNDFRSYFELGKKPKKLVKGRSLKNDAHWYGVSTFTNKEIIEFNMKFPNPHKKMAAGYVHCEGGPQETKDEHVCWWLYKDVNLSSFRIMEDKNE